MKQITKYEKYEERTFEDIKHVDEYGNEYWEARELQFILEYKEWRFFQKVIEKVQIACSLSKNGVNNHFGVYSKKEIQRIRIFTKVNKNLLNGDYL